MDELSTKEVLRRVILYNQKVSKQWQVPLGYLYEKLKKEEKLKK